MAGPILTRNLAQQKSTAVLVHGTSVQLRYPRLAFAQRARCAAAILLRPAAEIVRLGFVMTVLPFAFCFAHRAFCARLIFLRAVADIGRLLLPLLAADFPLIPRSASATCCNRAISCSTSAKNAPVSIGPPQVRP